MARCGCGGGNGNSCGCVVGDSTRVYASGTGTSDDPYTFDLASNFMEGNGSGAGTLNVDGTGQEGAPFELSFDPTGNVAARYIYNQPASGTVALNTLVDLGAENPYPVVMLSISDATALTLTNAILVSSAVLQRVQVFVRAQADATLTLPAESAGVKWVGGAAPAAIAMTTGQIHQFEFTGFYAWNYWMARQVTATPYS